MFLFQKLKRLVLYTILSVFGASLLIGLVPALHVNAAEFDDATLDKQKTILFNFSYCVSKYGTRDSEDNIVDTHHGHFGDSGDDDSIANGMDNDYMIVGLNVDNPKLNGGNGTLSCLDIITLGINILIDREVLPKLPETPPKNFSSGEVGDGAGKLKIYPSNENENAQKHQINEFFAYYTTGLTWNEIALQVNSTKKKVEISQSDFESKLNNLKSLSDAEIAKIQVSNTIIQAKYIDMFNICFDSYTADGSGGDTQPADYKLDIFSYPSSSPWGTFLLRDRNDMKPEILARGIHEGNDGTGTIGDKRTYRLDDVKLNFVNFGNGPSTPHFESKTTNWYPLGNDLAPFNEAGRAKPDDDKNFGIAECGMFIDDQSLQDLVLSNNVEIDPTSHKLKAIDGSGLEVDPNNYTDSSLGLTEDGSPSCESADALGWLICPIVDGFVMVNDAIFNNFIVPYLKVDPINTNEGIVYTIWSSFRTIGNIILVFALLFIVFGQSIGGGLIDAYTAKKAMPRIFVGAILINLSIYIVAFLVDLGNILGAGVGGLIIAPLKATGLGSYTVNGVAGLIAVIGVMIGLGLAIIAAVVIKRGRAHPEALKVVLTGAMLFGIPALLVVIGIFATLVIRLGTILMLCVISPVALALYVLPSTEKFAKKWLDLLIKAILVYPIVVAIFAIAGVLSVMISANVQGIDWAVVAGIGLGLVSWKGGLITGLIANGVLLATIGDNIGTTLSSILTSFLSIIVLLAPLAMIPFAFKLAGGLMGSVLQAVTKARTGASKLATGDKHNPHGRYMNFIGRAQHHRELLTRSTLDKTQASNLLETRKNEFGETIFDASGKPRYMNERPRGRRALISVFRRGGGVSDTTPPPGASFVQPSDPDRAQGGDAHEVIDSAQPTGVPATVSGNGDLLNDGSSGGGSTPSPGGGRAPQGPTSPWRGGTASQSQTAGNNPNLNPPAQQASGGLNRSNGGYRTNSGLYVPSTQEVADINDATRRFSSENEARQQASREDENNT